jgi:hypothetical protein
VEHWVTGIETNERGEITRAMQTVRGTKSRKGGEKRENGRGNLAQNNMDERY